MKLISSNSYYTVQEEKKGLRFWAKIESRDSKSSVAYASISAAKNTARSMIPKRFFLSPCSPRATSKTGSGRLGYDSYKDYDDMIPVIMYTDEDLKKPHDDELSFVDPFAFEFTKESPIVTKKKAIKKERVCSPTSVFGLFTVEEEGSFIDNCSDDEEEAVIFNDAFFPRSLARVFDENTSIDISESIHSVNVSSVSDGDEHEVADKDDGTPTSEWESFTSCEWEPESDNESFD